ncbi:MAG: serine--tRNA ligase [candidate division Zixibacteria bacterium]|nr:serine--tRNA ligase [candidate division Zixibacteria bacterium]
MLDQRFIRENPNLVRQAILEKNEKVDIDAFLALDEQRRTLLKEVETLKQRRNTVSEEIAQMKRKGEDATGVIENMRTVSDRIRQLDEQLASTESDLQALLVRIPNIPHPSVPVGRDASANIEVRRWGRTHEVNFPRKPHWEIGEALGILDFVRAGKITGSNFIVFKGHGARMERALIQFMLDLHTRKHGYTEIAPPFVVNRQSMFGTGQIPKMEEDMYRTEADDLFLIPTAEVPVTNLYRDEIIPEEELPVFYTAYSPCFRREAGSYGRDTRGLIRVHQFDKVEMVKFVQPETSYDELETLVQNAEEVLQLLDIPYRVLALSTGDLSFSAAKCYDLEAYAPGLDRWLEVSSCSNFEDFQARRANIRYRTKEGKALLVHTLNGSGLALPRTVIAIIEHYQTATGTVRIPEALQPYMDGCKEIG